MMIKSVFALFKYPACLACLLTLQGCLMGKPEFTDGYNFFDSKNFSIVNTRSREKIKNVSVYFNPLNNKDKPIIDTAFQQAGIDNFILPLQKDQMNEQGIFIVITLTTPPQLFLELSKDQLSSGKRFYFKGNKK